MYEPAGNARTVTGKNNEANFSGGIVALNDIDLHTKMKPLFAMSMG